MDPGSLKPNEHSFPLYYEKTQRKGSMNLLENQNSWTFLQISHRPLNDASPITQKG